MVSMPGSSLQHPLRLGGCEAGSKGAARKLCFRAAFRPDSGSGNLKISSPTGLRPAGGPILMFSRPDPGRNPARKTDFRPGSRGPGVIPRALVDSGPRFKAVLPATLGAPEGSGMKPLRTTMKRAPKSTHVAQTCRVWPGAEPRRTTLKRAPKSTALAEAVDCPRRR